MSIFEKIKSWFRRPELLLPDEFWRIYKERCILNKNDCSNKCGDYADCLVKAGYDPIFVVVKGRGRKNNHSIIKCNGAYYDPTYGIRSFKIKTMGSYRFSIPYEKRDEWGDEFKDYIESKK